MAFAHTEYERTVIGMDDYIKREALRDALYDADAITMNGVKILNQFPSSDVEPVKHGRWDDSGQYTFPGGSTAVRCTECGCALTVSEFRLNNWNYCPVCGAKMDGSEISETN